MFNNSKYTRWYYVIVDGARKTARKKSSDNYFEEHHILPRCVGGSDTQMNLVLLTGREHFLCHWLLCFMVSDPILKMKLEYAFTYMTKKSKWNKDRVISGWMYEIVRKHHASAASAHMKMRDPAGPISDFTRQRMSAAKKGKIRMHHKSTGRKPFVNEDEIKKYLDLGYVMGSGVSKLGKSNPMYGRVHSQKTLDKISKAKQGKSIVYDKKESKKRAERISDRNRDPMFIAQNSERKTKTYIVTDPNGATFEIKNLTRFCREHGLSPGNMTMVAQGKYPTTKGWKCRYN